MADKQIAEAVLLCQICDQIKNLRPHRDVKRRNRLIKNHQFRACYQGASDCDTLALAT